MPHTTQMLLARAGKITKQMREVLEQEPISEKDLLAGLSEGTIVLPANINHLSRRGSAIGKGLRTKVNVNLGISSDCPNPEMEWKKVELALKFKTDAIMDLSCYGNTQAFRRSLIRKLPVMIGTVPVYDLLSGDNKSIANVTVDDFFRVVEEHAKDSVDFMTIHAGLTRKGIERLRHENRLTSVVSRGGSLMLEWMEHHKQENPYYQYFDRLLEICLRYDVTISLGDGLRPGCLKDATDTAQLEELLTLGELTQRAREVGVQVIVEGPGHLPLNEVITNVQIQKKICKGAPFYVLGPLVTDIAPGYDHITSAIGGALAAFAGADFLCYVTPAEHLRLPSIEDVKEGLIAARIAAHSADIARGLQDARNWDDAMSEARHNLDWETMFKLAIDPQKAREYRQSAVPKDPEVCSMCGNLCAIKRSRSVLEKNNLM